MKKVLSATMLLISMNIFGQNTNLLDSNITGSHNIIIGKTMTVINPGTVIGQYDTKGTIFSTSSLPNEIKKDTISVIMLVCDTSFYNVKVYSDNGLVSRDWYNYSVKWIRGFKCRTVRFKREGGNISADDYYLAYGKDNEFFYKTHDYLNDKKQPLPEGIIIWQVR